MLKSPEAFRTISEVAETLDVPPHVLRFWESRFAQVKPVKRGGGRRYYRPEDVRLLRGIRGLLYDDGMTIKGVQKILRERGVRHVIGLGTVDDADERRPSRAGPSGTAELEEIEVDEIETGPGDAREPEDATADDAPQQDVATPEPGGTGVPSPGEGAPALSELVALEARRPAGGAPTGDRSALRELIARLEALRAVMAQGGRS